MSDPKSRQSALPRTQHDRALVWERVVAERGKGEKWQDIAERAQPSETNSSSVAGREAGGLDPPLAAVTFPRGHLGP